MSAVYSIFLILVLYYLLALSFSGWHPMYPYSLISSVTMRLHSWPHPEMLMLTCVSPTPTNQPHPFSPPHGATPPQCYTTPCCFCCEPFFCPTHRPYKRRVPPLTVDLSLHVKPAAELSLLCLIQCGWARAGKERSFYFFLWSSFSLEGFCQKTEHRFFLRMLFTIYRNDRYWAK